MRDSKFLKKLTSDLDINKLVAMGKTAVFTGTEMYHLFNDCPIKHHLPQVTHKNSVTQSECNCGTCLRRFRDEA